MGPAADFERELLHRVDARCTQPGQRVAAADDDHRADARRFFDQPAPRDGSADLIFVAGHPLSALNVYQPGPSG